MHPTRSRAISLLRWPLNNQVKVTALISSIG
jgi:hypothetical protein